MYRKSIDSNMLLIMVPTPLRRDLRKYICLALKIKKSNRRLKRLLGAKGFTLSMDALGLVHRLRDTPFVHYPAITAR